ncbi:MAG: hypothetical protein KDA91_13980 [Planctomycetaceae bacterium]|nr:hypothetical protein [Planctomycetaceae bacterium]
MTADDAIFCSAVRSLIVCVLSLLPARLLWWQITTSRNDSRKACWLAASVAPFFVPELLTGFTWRIVSARLVQSDTATELLYGLLLLCRAVSVAVIVMLVVPRSGVSDEAIHSWKLLRAGLRHHWKLHLGWSVSMLRLMVSGPWRPFVIAACLSGLVSFQEFETAALVQIDRHPITWTVWLFDAHAKHQPLARSLWLSASPLMLEILLLLPVLWLWSPEDSAEQPNTREAGLLNSGRMPSGNRLSTLAAASWLVVSLCLFLAWPVLSNTKPLLLGLKMLWTSTAMVSQALEQIAASLGFAFAASVLAMILATLILRILKIRSNGWKPVALLLLLPGLLGSLVTAIGLLAVFQTPRARLFYDSWLPMLLGLTLSILPRAFLIVALLHRMFDAAAWHSAVLLSASGDPQVRGLGAKIRWRLRGIRWIAAGTLLVHWCYWDVTTASVLRPVQLEPVVTRLYNEMHYGRTEAVLLITVLAAVAPWLLGGICWCVARLARI